VRATPLVFVTLAMCASSTTVSVERTPDFTASSSPRISVFGVFHDGKMSEQAWSALAPSVSKALDSPACDLGYGDPLRESMPELATTIDRSVRENGIDDDVLARVAPYASGELVMVLMSYRHIPSSRRRDGGVAPRAPQPARPMRRGSFRGGPTVRVGPEEEEHVFELSASLYSVRAHTLVAQIDLRHNGDDLDEAMATFTQKLRALIPGAKCVGWSWPSPDDAGVDSSGD